MTKESKALLQWLKKLAKNYSCVRWDATGDRYVNVVQPENKLMADKAVALLDKFETVEKQLSSGGLIKDYMGNICENGTSVFFLDAPTSLWKLGRLRWNPNEGAFLIDYNYGEVFENYYLFEVSEWHKETDDTEQN